MDSPWSSPRTSPQTPPRTPPRSPKAGPELDPYTTYIVDELKRYSSNASGLLATALQEADEEIQWQAIPNSRVPPPAQQAQYLKEETHLYCEQVAEDHDKWMRSESEVCQAHGWLRKQQMEVVKEYYDQYGVDVLSHDLLENTEMHLDSIARSGPNNVDNKKLYQARESWTSEVCKLYMAELRESWHDGQRKLLKEVSKEVRSNRHAAIETLERQLGAAHRLEDAAKNAWESKAASVQSDLVRVDQLFHNSIDSSLRSYLRELQQQTAEQAEYFKLQLADARASEKAEQELHGAHLRRMRLALLKWRHDYVAEAQRQAFAANLRIELGAQQEQEAKASRNPKEADKSWDLDDADAGDRLMGCFTVLEQIWKHVPAKGQETIARRDFLERVEKALPYNPQVLNLHTDFLASHGILAALDAAGPPPTLGSPS